MTMTKTKTSSSTITACPECDSGNLHFSGSEVECISCGWKLTAKGAAFTPDPKRSNVKHEQNQVTWLKIKALFTAEGQAVSLADIWAAIPTHRDFVGYAKRSGWLAAQQ